MTVVALISVVIAFALGAMTRPECQRCLEREDHPQLCDQCAFDEEGPTLS